jgi:hypothetical protein
MIFRLFRIRHLIFVAVALFAVTGRGAEAVGAENSEPLLLPTYTVTDSRALPAPEAWRHASMPGFEILSNASDRRTADLLRDFQLFNQAIGVVWPAILGQNNAMVSLILCGAGGKFDAFVPPSATGPERLLASLFLRDNEHGVIVLDLERHVMALSDLEATASASDSVASSGYMEVDAYKQLFREYVHSLLARTNPRLPAWTEEGLAQLLMGMKFSRTNIQFAKLDDPNEISVAQAAAAQENAAAAAAGEVGTATAAAEDGEFTAALPRRARMSFPAMFEVTRDSPVAHEAVGSRWAKQSCAFVHLCLYGVGQRYQQGFLNFVARTTKEAPTEAVFKECFGVNFKDMMFELTGYIAFTDYKSLEWNAKKGGGFPEPQSIVLREATQAEVGRIKGEALAMAGLKTEARATLIAPYQRGERDPALLAALGLYEQSVGDTERARKFLEAAVAGDVVRPRAYLELARARYQAAQPTPTAAGGRLSVAQTATIVPLLMRARTQPPPTPEIYDLMADTLVRADATPNREMLQVLLDGVNLFPRRLGIIYQTAVLCLRAGETKGAAALVEQGLRLAPEAATRARFAALKAGLPSMPGVVPAAPGKAKS